MKKVSDRERLSREVEALDDDQVLEVLEYISIMKSLRDQDANPKRFKEEVTRLFSSQEGMHHITAPSPQEGDVLMFPRSRRAVSK